MVHIDTINYIWAAIGLMMAIPGVLFVAWSAAPRMKTLSMLGAIVGAMLGYGAAFFMQINVLHTSIDGGTLLFGCFLLCSVTGLVGSLLVTFLFGSGNRPTRNSQVEF
jgi:hypothetical protein